MPQPTIASFDEFCQFLSDQLAVSKEVLTPDTNFLYDLAIESLKLLELMLQLELQLGVRVPSDAAWDIQTVGDAYQLYVDLVREDPQSHKTRS
jgi:acyl carrier protein